MTTFESKLKIRHNGLKEWLHKDYPKIFKEQKHTDKNAHVEKSYWHYGYYVALGDVLRLMEKQLEEMEV